MTKSEWLRESREHLGLSQTDLRNLLNAALNRSYDKSRISRWENSKENIPAEVIKQIESLIATRKNRAKVIALANQKGGVGKTTSSLNIAAALRRVGRRVLLVDLDPQASASDWLLGSKGLDYFREGRSIYHNLLNDRPIEECIIRTEEDDNLQQAGFDLISSHINLAEADSRREPGFEHALAENLDRIANDYEFIIIDAPPNLGLMTYMALVAADVVIVPVQTEPPDAMGVALLLSTVQKIQRRLNPQLRVGGILPTRYNGRQSVDREVLHHLIQSTAGAAIVLEPIPESAVYGNAAWGGVIAVDASPKAKAVAPYVRLCSALASETPLPMALLNLDDDTQDDEDTEKTEGRANRA